MRVLKAEIKEEIVTISFKKLENIRINTYISMIKDDKEYYFKVSKITAICKDHLDVEATETGYWADRLYTTSNFDLRNILGSNLTEITDKNKIREIDKESGWC